jgi:hypothetical protein
MPPIDRLPNNAFPADYVVSLVHGGKTVLLDVHGGAYYLLNDVAGRIWALCCEQVPFSAILDVIASDFGVARDVAERDCLRFVGQLHEAQLVECR